MKNYFQHLSALFKRLFLALVLFSVARLFFLALNLPYFNELSFNEAIRIFFFGIRFDISALLYFNLIFIALHIIPGNFKNYAFFQKTLKIIFIVVNSLLLMSNFGDSEYFKFINKRSSAYVLKLFGASDMGNDGLRLLPQFLKDYWYILLSWFVVTIASWYAYPRLIIRKHLLELPNINTGKFLIQSIISILILGILTIGARGGLQLKPLRIINAAEYVSSQYVPLILNTPFTIMKTFNEPELRKVNYMNNNELQNIYNPIFIPDENASFREMNIIVILLESFSKEYIGSLSGKKTYTPFLDSLINHSLSFENGYANGTQSIEALPSVLASLPALMDNPYISSYYAANQINSFASLLKDKGYHSSLYHGLTNGSMGFDKFALVAGIDEYHGRTEYNNEDDYDGNWGIYDEEFLKYTVKSITEKPKPFFSCVMTLSSHHPYTLRDKYKKRFKGGDLPVHKVIQYSDYALQQFFDEAKKTNWYKNTLFIFTADHTAQAVTSEYKNKVGKYRVPIIFFHPSDSSILGKSSMVMQQSDILPSVMDYLGYDKSFITFGSSVFDAKSERFAVSYISGIYQLIHNGFVLQFDGEQSIALFDLQKDPLLKNNLVRLNVEQVSRMELFIKAIIQQYNNRILSNKTIIQKA